MLWKRLVCCPYMHRCCCVRLLAVACVLLRPLADACVRGKMVLGHGRKSVLTSWRSKCEIMRKSDRQRGAYVDVP